MLDFFAIFSKGGIVLWCFQGAGVAESFTGPVNALIRSVILQVKPRTPVTLEVRHIMPAAAKQNVLTTVTGG